MTPRHVVMFSGGRTSWATARRVADTHGTDGLTLLFADVGGEDPDAYRFIVEASADVFGVALPNGVIRQRDLFTRHGWRRVAASHLPGLAWVADGRTIWDVFRDDRFLGNSRLANCSKILKQKPCRDWMDANAAPDTVVHVGIGWDEQHRLPAIQAGWAPWRVEAPMTQPPYMDHAQIDAWMKSRGLRRPRLYDLGATHNNCGGGCVRAGQGQFAWLLDLMPDRYAEWEAGEQSLRDHLGKDVTILRDRTGGDVVPLSLADFRQRIEDRPDQLDLFDMGGCGCFTDDGVTT